MFSFFKRFFETRHQKGSNIKVLSDEVVRGAISAAKDELWIADDLEEDDCSLHIKDLDTLVRAAEAYLKGHTIIYIDKRKENER